MRLQNVDILTNNEIPGINTEGDINPTLKSPYSSYELPFYQTRDTLADPDIYRQFLNSAMTSFRRSRTYKNYKSFLINLGLDRCHIHGNINTEMATIEMHHNIINLMDIALIITEHTLETRGLISTFDLVTMLKQEHVNHRIPLVMLSLTAHQLYHDNDDLFIHPDACIGDWISLLEKYNKGITYDIATKIYYYIDNAILKGTSDDNRYLNVRDRIFNWGDIYDRN